MIGVRLQGGPHEGLRWVGSEVELADLDNAALAETGRTGSSLDKALAINLLTRRVADES
jgi:hypothetical protein